MEHVTHIDVVNGRLVPPNQKPQRPMGNWLRNYLARKDMINEEYAKLFVLEIANLLTSGNQVPTERVVITHNSDLFDLLCKALPNWQFTTPPGPTQVPLSVSQTLEIYVQNPTLKELALKTDLANKYKDDNI